jgi:hypothetical protein
MTGGADGAEPLVIEPSGPAIVASLRAAGPELAGGTLVFGRTLADWREESRAFLGLPVDRPIVATGHQAGLWHAGILAKWLVVDAISRSTGAATAAIIVDQDTNDAGAIAYPSPVDGRPRRATLPTLPSRRGGPTGLARTVRVAPPEEPPADGLDAPLAAIAAAVNARAGQANLAAQMAAANDDLLQRRLGLTPPPSIPASRLVELPFAREFLARFAADPRANASYVEALAADPRAARPLAPGELPLWRLVPGDPHPRREPVRVGDAPPPAGGRLAPRAFLLTAISRLVACDLFIHGTGGGRYERVTEDWIGRWLGLRLAPMAVASATLRLPLGHLVADRVEVTPAEFRRRSFDPDATGAGPSEALRDLLSAIDAAPRRSATRRAAYRALIAHRELRRTAVADELARLATEAERTRSLAAAIEVARSRTWPWPLHDDARLSSLANRIRGTIE